MGNDSQLLIIGAGGHALCVADAALSGDWKLVGFYAPGGSGPAESLGRVFSSLASLDLSETSIALGIGANHAREEALKDVIEHFPQVNVTSVVHQTAWISPSASVHPGSVILAHATVGPGSIVGSGAMLNTGASLDHESTLGDFAVMGPGARTGGNVRIGARTMIGLQAAILQGISIGSDAVIGANSLVNRDIENNAVAWGSPARVVRSRAREDPYY